MTDDNTRVPGADLEAELTSQPDVWERAVALSPERALLPADGQRIAVVGCGTSWFMAQSYASLRERTGHGETDAFAASEALGHVMTPLAKAELAEDRRRLGSCFAEIAMAMKRTDRHVLEHGQFTEEPDVLECA